MNKILNTILLISSIGIVCAQSEPEAVNTKDLNEKINRSDILTDDVNGSKMNNLMPTMEMPLIEFNEKPVVSKNTQTEKSVNKPVEKLATKVEPKSELVKTSKPKKQSVVFAKRPISINQLYNNDKIVINKGKTYVYRQTKSNIMQYKFKGKLPLDSLGLKPSGANSYYVINKGLVAKDAKSTPKKVSKTTKTKTVAKKKETVAKKVVKADLNDAITSEVMSKRKLIENKHNNGKEITESIKLNNLRVNDKIYLIDGLQFVIRKSRNTSGVKKYWLIESINTNSRSLKKETEFKYKVIKYYIPN